MQYNLFPAGSAGGPDGLRPQHLKIFILFDQNQQLLHALTDLVNTLLGGKTIRKCWGNYFWRKINCAQKERWGSPTDCNRIHPTPTSSQMCKYFAIKKIVPVLSPKQLGSGISREAEAAVDAARRYLECLPDGYAMVKLDFKNVFNSLRRDHMLNSIEKLLPEIYRFVHSSYLNNSLLQFGNYTISSEEGTQQGGPLGPLEFSISIHHLFEESTLELVIGYLDDFTLGGPIHALAADVDRFRSDAAKVGLELNVSTCEIICNENDKSLFLWNNPGKFQICQQRDGFLARRSVTSRSCY